MPNSIVNPLYPVDGDGNLQVNVVAGGTGGGPGGGGDIGSDTDPAVSIAAVDLGNPANVIQLLKAILQTNNGPMADHSGTVATALTSVSAVIGQPNRTYLFLQNLSTGNMWVNFGAAATAGSGSIKLLPNGGAYEMFGVCSTDEIFVLAESAGSEYTLKVIQQ